MLKWKCCVMVVVLFAILVAPVKSQQDLWISSEVEWLSDTQVEVTITASEPAKVLVLFRGQFNKGRPPTIVPNNCEYPVRNRPFEAWCRDTTEVTLQYDIPYNSGTGIIHVAAYGDNLELASDTVILESKTAVFIPMVVK